MALYATVEEIQARGQNTDALEDADAWEALAESAARYFDAQCEVEPDFFKTADGSATEKTFRSDGTSFLKMPPFNPDTAPVVTYPSGYTVPDFDVHGQVPKQFLKIRAGSYSSQSLWWGSGVRGWDEGIDITVEAKWGWKGGTPADVKQAVIEIALFLFRNSDGAFRRMSGLEGGTPDLTLPTKQTIKKYKEMCSRFVNF